MAAPISMTATSRPGCLPPQPTRVGWAGHPAPRLAPRGPRRRGRVDCPWPRRALLVRGRGDSLPLEPPIGPAARGRRNASPITAAKASSRSGRDGKGVQRRLARQRRRRDAAARRSSSREGGEVDKVGLATGYDPSMSVREMAEVARQAESRGFDMAFFSEALLCNRDSVTAMAAFGLATSRIALGCTQVVRLRSPVVMAQTLASLDELTGGRLVLAPGACTEKHARRHGLAPITPALTLREWVETTRRLLAGERVTYSGMGLDLEGAVLNWKPRRPHIPFWIAALSRTGLKVA